jgi:hypothetical protein
VSASGSVRTVFSLLCLAYLAATRVPGVDAPASLAVLVVTMFLVVAVVGPRFWSKLARLRPYGLPAVILLVLLPSSERAPIQAPWMATMAIALVLLHLLHEAPRRSDAKLAEGRLQFRRLTHGALALAILVASAALAQFLPHLLPEQFATLHEIQHLGASVVSSLIVASVLVSLALLRELLSRPATPLPPQEVGA